MITKLTGWAVMGCAIAITGSVRAEGPRPGSVEHELAIQTGILESVSTRLARKKEELQIYRGYQEIAAKIEASRNELGSIQKEIAALETKKIEAGDELSLVQLMFEDYRDQYRLSERRAAEGEILDLSETKGESYQACKVLGISALHLRVARPTGAEGIPFRDLPAAIQDRFQFSNEEAAEYASKLAKSDAARALAYQQWRSGKNTSPTADVGAEQNEQLVQLELLAKKTRDESDRLRKESDEWREKAARYWKSISDAKSPAGQKSRENLASRAESKADQYLEISRVTRLEAERLDGEVFDLKAQIKAGK